MIAKLNVTFISPHEFIIFPFRLNGCYETLNNGKASEGLLDLTGGLTEVYYPSKMQGPELFHVIRLALKNGAFLSCNTVSRPV